MTRRIAMLSVLVPDYDEGIAFFRDVLGFAITEDRDMGGGKRWLRAAPPGGGTDIVIARAATPDQSATTGRQGGGRVWLFLQTDDFDADHARMVAAGIGFEEAPRDEPYGKVAVFADPWGNRWDLLQPGS